LLGAMNLKRHIFVFKSLKNSISCQRCALEASPSSGGGSFELSGNKCYYSSNKPKFEIKYNSGKDNNPKENGTSEKNNKPKLDKK